MLTSVQLSHSDVEAVRKADHKRKAWEPDRLDFQKLDGTTNAGLEPYCGCFNIRRE